MTDSSSGLPRVIILHPNDGCLTIARSLARRGVEVYALPTPQYAYVLRSRAVRAGRVMPAFDGNDTAWLTELEGFAAEGGGVVLCGSDAATEWVATNHPKLPPSLRTFESGDGVHMTLMDKLSLYELAAQVDVRVPWTRHVADRTELADVLDEITYPCIVKPRMGHLSKQLTGIGTSIAESRPALLATAGKLLDHGIDLLLSQIVPGPESGLEGAVTVRDAATGEYTLEYGRHKVRQWPLDTGVGSLLEAADVPETLAMNRRLMDHVGYHGVAACETKRHSGTGEIYLIEINVRVPASFGLADACGVDGSWRLYSTLAGLPLGPQRPQVDGRKVALPQKDVRSAVQRVRRGDASVGEVLRSWRGVRDLGAFDVRDPAPAVSLVRYMMGRSVRRSG